MICQFFELLAMSNKCFIVIAGTVDNLSFHYACFIALNLSRLLPNFHFQKICKDVTEWEAHEVERKIGSLEIKKEYRRVTVVGAGRSLCLDLISQLTAIRELHLSRGIVFSLYDEPENFSKLERITKELRNVDEDLNAMIVRDMSSGLRDCDILIFLEDMTREECKDHDTWYRENYDRMKTLSQQINEYAPCQIKIVFCSAGPTCLCATILRNLAAKSPETSVVVVSAHYGLEVVHDMTESLDTDRRDFGCPPVWGFLGISQFVDVCHMVQKRNIYSLGKGDTSAEAKESTLKLPGVEQAGLKWFCSFKDNENRYGDYLRRKITTQRQVDPQKENLRKCRAICDLLKLWHKESVGDEIIALGISSDGSFGIPSGIVFSQPACLKISDGGARVWVPCDDFPLPDMPVSIFRNLISTAVEITRRLMSADTKYDVSKIPENDMLPKDVVPNS
ncbi:PREDICTED: malate dehydrogenase, cytoplasmic-like [Vollenhovia emeryi]|uniref:malate dehydrogenase, cytoplasmic-like n=1 Tax=Vollenhovia emeryi TaxID=411798 RepID=UPI0005F4D763|nr:PREDICTED: malate dehydrogenase, cytoplasmic-like [Vollenhovia emeryi]